MNKEYKIKLDLNKKLYNKKMAFNQFDENVNDFYIEVTKNNEVVKDLDKAIVVLAVIKPNKEVDSQFVEVENGVVYANLKPSMKDEIGIYTARAMLILESEKVVTDVISYEVKEDKIFSLLNDTVETTEEFTLLTDMLSRLSTIEISEEQRVINEAERILSEENRKIEEAKRVEAELIRQHEEADRTKYEAIRESNENTRKQNESIRLANETNRIDEEAKRVEEENKRKLAEEERNANYNFMTEDEERRRSEANAHKEAEVLRVQAETNRVNEEAKRRTTEQARVSAENTRVNNENTREANETTRQNNENQRVEAETQRQNRYNSFIADAEANANNFENYTNAAKVKEEERKANELDRKSQEDRRISNEVERISNENTRKANEVVREKNETSRQNIFESKVNEVDKKIIEINATKDNFVSSVNTKVDTKISELDNAKSDMTNTVSNKIQEVETRFNTLTSTQQQDAEVIDARDGETSLKARLDRDIEKAKQVYVNVEGSNISTDSSSGYLKDVEIKGNTIQDASNLADIRSVGDKVEGQELYEIPVLSVGKNLVSFVRYPFGINADGNENINGNNNVTGFCKVRPNTTYVTSINGVLRGTNQFFYNIDKKLIGKSTNPTNTFTTPNNCYYVRNTFGTSLEENFQLEEGTVATPYEPYQEDKLTILSPTPLEKVGDVRDRIIEKDGVWGVEKNIESVVLDGNNIWHLHQDTQTNCITVWTLISNNKLHYTVVSNQFINNGIIRDDKEGVMSNGNMPQLYLNISRSKASTLDEWKNYLNNNNLKVLYITSQPQFIPLPHDQQVKLRTFANKTNISFLTEIEGTIKAQVPKSLGATVNTHTEQINNLNKELDRVKKLEESTVSTVTTESDFTTVEATSNGYFEDVKLEGRTLVNKLNPISNITESDTTFSAYTNTILEPSVYTIINNSAKEIFFNVNNASNGSYIATITLKANEKSKILKYDVQVKIVNFGGKKDMGWSENNKKDLGKQIILEGDHTQNPPNGHIEGLKSVGQSATTSEDGTDEIVVSSVKGDGNLFGFESKKFNCSSIDWYDVQGAPNMYSDMSKKTQCQVYLPAGTYTVGYDGVNSINVSVFQLVSIDDKVVVNANSSENFKGTKFLNEGVYTIRVRNASAGEVFVKDVQILKGDTFKPYTPHQPDKKRLLYYNNETQTWEKPILREWDSIEKHANGKYYYHQRSGEVVLNGSENWGGAVGIDNDNFKRYQLKVTGIFHRPYDIVIISDKFKSVTNKEWTLEEKKIEADSNFIYITTDILTINEFKQWLQANNVTVVYQLAQEKVYECTNIDLITYEGETNYIVESGAIAPKTTLKVHNNISNVVSLLQKKVSLLESNITRYTITQNRLMLTSRYNADTVGFKVDVATLRNSFEYDNDLYELILNNILVGKDNYDREYIENLIIFYWMDFVISDEMHSALFEIIEEQHNPKVIEDEEAPL